MKPGPRYRVKPRRRREGITDYKKRLHLLRSGKTRIVVRKSIKQMSVQFVNYKEKGDEIQASAMSSELVSLYNWKFSTSSTPAAYLTGFLAAKRAKEKGITEGVLDIGRQVPVNGSKIFAVLKGVLDGGIDCPHDEDKLPIEDRIKGKHLKKEMMSATDDIKVKITGGK
jgi:large subunit ribosomal protein L18